NGALPMVTMSRVNSCVTRSASSRFTTKRAILPSYEFTLCPVLGPFVFPDARPSSKQKSAAREGNTFFQFVLRKRRNKVPKHSEQTLASKTFRPPIFRALWQSQRTEIRYWEIIADKLSASGL